MGGGSSSAISNNMAVWAVDHGALGSSGWSSGWSSGCARMAFGPCRPSLPLAMPRGAMPVDGRRRLFAAAQSGPAVRSRDDDQAGTFARSQVVGRHVDLAAALRKRAEDFVRARGQIAVTGMQ